MSIINLQERIPIFVKQGVKTKINDYIRKCVKNFLSFDISSFYVLCTPKFQTFWQVSKEDTVFWSFSLKNLVFQWNIKKYMKKNQYLMTFLFCAVRLRLPQKGQQSSHCHFMIENTFTGIKTSCSVSHLEFLCIPFHTISSISRLINNSVKKLRFFTDRTNINVKAFHRKTTHLFSVYWSKSTAIFILPNQPASCSR